MKKIFSFLLSLVIIIGCFPIVSNAISYKNSIYAANTENVKFNENYAQVGELLSVSVDYDGDIIYKWYIDKTEIKNSGNSYIPVESDIESMITVEAYEADGEFIGNVSMLVSKLPVMYIETENREKIVKKDKNLKAHMTLQGNEEFSDSDVLYDGEMEIKGRGNYTWQADKKPYKIKLDTKTNLLGMGKNKHWVLLSNPYDSTLSRNKLIYDLASDIGLSAMSSQWVEVVLNGEHIGNYLLCEHIRIGETRVDITNWDDIAEDVAKAIYKANKDIMTKDERDELAVILEADMNWVSADEITYNGKTYIVSDYYELPSINGGYLLEGYTAFDVGFVSDMGASVSVNKPEGIGDDMLNEIREYYNAFERALNSEDFCTEYNGEKVRYSDLVDMESFAKYVLINVMFQNGDFPMRSTYIYKEVDGKLVFGPVWDMDLSSDNSGGNCNKWYNWDILKRGSFLVARKDPVFMKAFYNAYREYRYTAIEDLIKSGGDFDTTYKKLYESGKKNDALWKYTDGNVFENSLINFKYWVSRRINWLDSKMTDFATFYSSVNDTSLNNSGASTLTLTGNTLEILSDSETVAQLDVYVDGTKLASLPTLSKKEIVLPEITASSIVSVYSYDLKGDYIGSSSISSREPTWLKIAKYPTKLSYKAGEAIDLNGLELQAYYSDGTYEIVQPEATLSYVDDCLGEQIASFNQITDEIGTVYVALKYKGRSVSFKVERDAFENYDEVNTLIAALPESNVEDNLQAIFETKQAYDALSDTAKQYVENPQKIDEAMALVDALAENSESYVVGCYADESFILGRRVPIVVVAKDSPNKIRFFNDGVATTWSVSDRNQCVSVKKIGNYSLITSVNMVGIGTKQFGAYYNHILKGTLYSVDGLKLHEKIGNEITSISYPKFLNSVDEIATLELVAVDRVEKIKLSYNDKEFVKAVENGSAVFDLNLDKQGNNEISISHYSDGAWHSDTKALIYVRTAKSENGLLGMKYSASTANDTETVYVATSADVKSVSLNGKQNISLVAAEKNGIKIWSGLVDVNESYSLYVNSENTGKSISFKKLDKLVIENGKIIRCQAKNGIVDIPQGVSAVADGAFDGFMGVIHCYRDSAAVEYAEKNGIDYIIYGYSLELQEELKMNVEQSFCIEPTPSPIIAPDFSLSILSDNTSVVCVSGNTVKALKSGYARLNVKSNDGKVDREIKIYVDGGYSLGDVNADGAINSLDALIILRNSVGAIDFSDDEKAVADINGDNVINSVDALTVLQIVTSLHSIWEFV